MHYIKYFLIIFCLLVSFTGRAEPVSKVFEHAYQTQLLMHIEASLAEAQARHDIIPTWAAEEIRAKVNPELVTEAEFQATFDEVRHRMVALLTVRGSKMANGAEQYLHFGATTVDIYDTLMVLQLLETIQRLQAQQLQLELALMKLTREHIDTVMIGRTLGQHALPITFGKKVSGWLAENRRHINRLSDVQALLRKSAILKGAVGSYLGLGEKGPLVEQDYARQLGLDVPYPDDWHASRDVFADYAMTLAMMSKSLGRIGQTVFLLQSTDIGEVVEQRPGSAVSSSSMPHKKNPSRSEALILAGRKVPALAEVILADMVNFYERDNTSGPNRVLVELSIAADEMLKDANVLISRLQVYPEQMRTNLSKTKGLITAQRLSLALAPHMGKQRADQLIKDIAQQTYTGNASFTENLQQNPLVTKHLSSEDIASLTDLTTYLGQDRQLVEAVLDWVSEQRKQ